MDHYTDTPSIEEMPEFWTSEEIERYLKEEEDHEDYYHQWDNDQALEEYSLECAFGPEE